MKDLNETTIRMQLVNRYLNAETTIEEEQMLRKYYAQTEEVLTPEENDVRLLIMSSARFAGEFALSEEKADEFDRLMAKKPAKRVALYWIVSAAAAIIIAFFLLTNKQVDECRQHADALSKKALWSEFIQYYYEAYDIALCKAEKRKKKQ